ncbi:CHAD domain-containing protein [Dyella sp.]|uniref:CHAD domain-containing protein n=1 Tax=Dyella sp. TaxID=1869338 RepID=UPI002ED45EA0
MYRNIGGALAELAGDECACVIKALGSGTDRHRSVHEARKAIRRLRSILALVRDDMGDQVAPVDHAFKRLGEGLSALRDAHVVIASASRMAQGGEAGLWPPVIQRLTMRRDRLLADALAKDPGFLRRQKRALKLAHAIGQLPWIKVRKRSVEAALKLAGKRVDKARSRFESDPKPLLLHKWRRRVRRQRMQVMAWNEATAASTHPANQQAKALSRLSDALGWRQDLQVLRSHVRRVATPDELPRLLAHIRQAMQHASL